MAIYLNYNERFRRLYYSLMCASKLIFTARVRREVRAALFDDYTYGEAAPPFTGEPRLLIVPSNRIKINDRTRMARPLFSINAS